MTDHFEIPDFLNRNKDKSMTTTIADNAAKLREIVPPLVEDGLLTAAVAAPRPAPGFGLDDEEKAHIAAQSAALPTSPRAPRQKRTAAFKITVEGYIAYDDTDPADMARVASLVAEKDAAKLASAMSGVTVSHTHGRFKGIA